MKKTLKLIPAIVMLLVSAILVSTSTYAWFSMNTQVTATNMQVRAVAEKGLLINEVATAADTNWDEEASAKQGSTEGDSPISKLYPASTANGTAWYHAGSKKSNSAARATGEKSKSADLVSGYTQLTGLTAIADQSVATATAGSKAKFSTMGTTATSEAGYYVQYEYYLKAASGSAISLGKNSGDMNVMIKSVEVDQPTNKTSEDLNKAIRVGIRMKSSGELYIYSPIDGATTSYYVYAGGSDGNTNGTLVNTTTSSTVTQTDLDLLPAAGSNGAKVDVYIWYEGEDANCKSDNARAATLDNLTVTITFYLGSV